MTKEQIDFILEKQVKDRKHFNGIGVPNVKERIHLFLGLNMDFLMKAKLENIRELYLHCQLYILMVKTG